MTNEEYIKQGGMNCPNCSPEMADVDYDGGAKADNTTAMQSMYCMECDSTWDVDYKIVGFSNLRVGD